MFSGPLQRAPRASKFEPILPEGGKRWRSGSFTTAFLVLGCARFSCYSHFFCLIYQENRQKSIDYQILAAWLEPVVAFLEQVASLQLPLRNLGPLSFE